MKETWKARSALVIGTLVVSAFSSLIQRGDVADAKSSLPIAKTDPLSVPAWSTTPSSEGGMKPTKSKKGFGLGIAIGSGGSRWIPKIRNAVPTEMGYSSQTVLMKRTIAPTVRFTWASRAGRRFGFEPQIGVFQSGFERNYEYVYTDYFDPPLYASGHGKTTMTYLHGTLFGKYQIGKGLVRFILLLGPTIDGLLFATEEDKGEKPSYVGTSYLKRDVKDNFPPIQFGVEGGLGIELQMKKGTMRLVLVDHEGSFTERKAAISHGGGPGRNSSIQILLGYTPITFPQGSGGPELD